MAKFNSRERVTYEELSKFIPPLKFEIPIELQSTFVRNSDFYDYLLNINQEIVINLLPYLDEKYKKYIVKYIPISYVPHMDGYSVSLSPMQFINNLLVILGNKYNVDLEDYKLPFYNLDDDNERKIFKTSVVNRVAHIKKSINNEDMNKTLDHLSSNIDELLKIRDFDLSTLVSNCVEIKTLLFYLVYSSLRQLEKTNNSIYSVLPMTYMNDVYKPDALQFPKHVFVRPSAYKLGIGDFVREYNNLYMQNSRIFNYITTDNLGVNTYIGNFELLPSGEVEKKLKDYAERHRIGSNIDYAKYYRLFNTKMNYYFHTDVKHILMGNMGLDGYFAFVYGNEYIVSDKFYNSLLVPDYRRSILTHEEGLYALPSDRLDVIAMNKQKIKQEKIIDTRIKKYNHDPNNNWINRVNKIIEGANVSTATFEDKIVDLENKGILTLRKKI